MLRNLLAGITAGVTVGLFVLIVFQTRPLEQSRVDDGGVSTMVRQSVDEWAGWQSSVAAAREQRVPVGAGNGVQYLDRLTELHRRLGELQKDSNPELSAAISSFNDTVETQLDYSRRWTENHNAYYVALAYLRSDSADVVRRLREAGGVLTSQDVFALVVATLDYAANEPVDFDAINNSISLLTQYKEASLDPEVTELLTAIDTVLTQRDAETALASKIAVDAVTPSATRVFDTLNEARYSDAQRSRNAWVLLSVFGALLLAGIVLLAWRYRKNSEALEAANLRLASASEKELGMATKTSESATAPEAAITTAPEAEPGLFSEPIVSHAVVNGEKSTKTGGLTQRAPELPATKSRLVGRFSQEISTHLWYLLNNATLVKERLDELADFVTTAESTLSLFAGPNTDRERVIEGLKTLRQKLQAEHLSEELTMSRSLTQDSIDGLGELATLIQRFGEITSLDNVAVEGFDMNEALDKVIQELQQDLEEPVMIRKDYRALTPVTCNRSQIDQALYVLLAKVAGLPSASKEMWVRTQQLDGKIEVTVADSNGESREGQLPGPDKQSVSLEESGEHIEIGLFIADQIINAQGGELMVGIDTEPGSTFTMLLPADATNGLTNDTTRGTYAPH